MTSGGGEEEERWKPASEVKGRRDKIDLMSKSLPDLGQEREKRPGRGPQAPTTGREGTRQAGQLELAAALGNGCAIGAGLCRQDGQVIWRNGCRLDF